MAVKTPLMRQYYSIKTKHPDAILLFRVGDFYETFEEDAVKSSEILGITLTRRANGSASYVDLAGFPYHSLDTYLPKLIRAGQRVAICEQLEDPKATKSIVKRGVTELITPGVTLNDNALENKENNFLACVSMSKQSAAVAFADVTTGDFYTAEGTYDYISKLLSSFRPKEVLFERSKKQIFEENFGHDYYSYPAEDWMFTYDAAYERLLKQFETNSLKGFGIENMQFAITSAGALMNYLDLTQHSNLKHISSVSKIPYDKYVVLDRFTIRNLELFHPLYEGGKALIDVLDKTRSPMGSRMLRRWLAFPLTSLEDINKRLNATDFFKNNTFLKSGIEAEIRKIHDIERLLSKISTGRINPREIVHLKNALLSVKQIVEELSIVDLIPEIEHLKNNLIPMPELTDFIKQQIDDEPPTQLGKGNVIKSGVSEELDELRNISNTGQQFLADLRERLSKITKIPSLKISFNKVFGYYIEVTNVHKNRVPEDWIRKQTLVNAERYITPELKEYEEKILTANDKINEIESKLFAKVIIELQNHLEKIKSNAKLIAETDCYIGFANLAEEYHYNKPVVNDSMEINIKDGRHPVIEQQLPLGEEYIPNDVFLDDKEQQIIVITGPNMAGKSALLRQTALITLMAQIGSFVPAESANIGFVDKIFTRVGASDNISLGESTFMVEMNEAANILNNISSRSLILFDELGRGTSTYDGISIAWSIVEYIHQLHNKFPKTLFATHYHELNEMEKLFNRIKNYNVTVREENKKVIFMRKLVRGGSEHSFGIHVAKMAGMPKSVVKRSEEILLELEKQHTEQPVSKPATKEISQHEGYQLQLFQLDDPVLKNIRDLIIDTDVNNLTPIEALNTLDKIKRQLNG
ncbi:MAG: DNA mismatch repair protein MutS [Bacteroidales bacterium]|nr:DNA mismatch repair protein MutS [Bacteroidales bacterium]